MPLTADLDGQRIMSCGLMEADRGKDYRCRKPTCKKLLILVISTKLTKAGVPRITHFRHKSGNFHSEPETPEHAAAKQFIYDLMTDAGILVELEVWYGEHVADIVVDEKLVIEVQYSGISTENILKRTIFHREHGRYVLWVLVVGKTYGRNFDAYKVLNEYWLQNYRTRKSERYVNRLQLLYYFDSGRLFRGRWNRSGLRYSHWGAYIPKTLGRLVLDDLSKVDFLQECV